MTGIGSEIRQACVSGKILHVSGCEWKPILKSHEGPYGNKVALIGTVSEEVKFPVNECERESFLVLFAPLL